ncbi:MAG: glycosyltransferase [bacterium]|nr:glycosyltransferase [bacterium]
MKEIHPSDTPEISIIIGTLNRPQALYNLIGQLDTIAEPIRIEVIIFDQSDEAVYIKNKERLLSFTFCRVIRFSPPHTCKYLNRGWNEAKSPIVLYLDDDVKITSTTIPSHLNAYRNPSTMGVAGRVINKEDPIDSHIKEVGKIKYKGAVIKKDFFSEESGTVDFPYGCNMSFRKSALADIGGFDEKLAPPIYSYNEVDLGYRISERWPKSLVFKPSALVYHLQSPSGGTRSYRAKEIKNSSFFNYGYFIGKNFSYWENVIFLLRRLPYQFVKEREGIAPIVRGFIKGKINRS